MINMIGDRFPEAFQVDENFTVDNWGGYCPRQATGLIDGKPFYFRSRWTHWSFGIGTDEDSAISGSVWETRHAYDGTEPNAGYIDEYEMIVAMCYAAIKYRAERDGEAFTLGDAEPELVQFSIRIPKDDQERIEFITTFAARFDARLVETTFNNDRNEQYFTFAAMPMDVNTALMLMMAKGRTKELLETS